MKFIFPKNYKYKSKILGFIDYVTAIFDLILGAIVFGIIHLFFSKLSTQIYIFIIIYFPIVLFSIIGIGGENIIEYSICIYKFIKRRTVYFYNKK